MHKRINIIIFFSIIFVVLLIETSEAQVKISRNVFGNGIGNLTGASHNIHSIAGQTLTGISIDQIYTSEVGFWYAAYRVVTEVTNPQDFLPEMFELFQNYPNPFNPSTTLSFVIGHSSFVSLKVYDILGREVATLVNEEKLAGNYEVQFDALSLTSGVYFYKLQATPAGGQAGSFVEIKKMILLH